MASEGDGSGGEEAAGDVIRRCDYCRLPIPGPTVTYQYCSQACRDAIEESDTVFTQFHGFRRPDTGVSVLDTSLPQGSPRIRRPADGPRGDAHGGAPAL